MLKIAIISDHASPLAAPGSIDCGGQNVYVAHLACQLARLGCAVDIFTRATSSELPTVLGWMALVHSIVGVGEGTGMRRSASLETSSSATASTAVDPDPAVRDRAEPRAAVRWASRRPEGDSIVRSATRNAYAAMHRVAW